MQGLGSSRTGRRETRYSELRPVTSPQQLSPLEVSVNIKSHINHMARLVPFIVASFFLLCAKNIFS